MNNHEGLSANVLQSGAYITGGRVLTRLLQLVRTLTIARWLGPDEIGVFAVASLAIATIEHFSETGFKLALIQRPGEISPYILPVRTVLAVRGLLIGLIMFIAAPWLATFFHSPKSLTILRVMSLLPVINGFEPLFLTLSQRELRFGPVVAVQVGASLIGLVIGIVAAYFQPNAWSLVWASLTSAFITTVAAHILSHRRKLGFTFKWRSLKDIQNFGFWIFVTTVVAYIFLKGGDWMIGRLLDVNSLALYTITYSICTTVTAEVGSVISQLSFPVFSRVYLNQLRLRTAFRTSFGTISIVTFFIGGVVIVCAPDFYRLVLGEKWLSALPLVPFLTIWGITTIFSSAQSGLFKGIGNPKIWTITAIIMTMLFGIGVFPMTRWLGALGVAILIAGIGIIMQFIRYQFIADALKISYFKIVEHIIFPFVVCAVSIGLTFGFQKVLPINNHLYRLIFSGFSYFGVYVVFLIFGSKWFNPSPRELINLFRKRRLLSSRVNTQEIIQP